MLHLLCVVTFLHCIILLCISFNFVFLCCTFPCCIPLFCIFLCCAFLRCIALLFWQQYNSKKHIHAQTSTCPQKFAIFSFSKNRGVGVKGVLGYPFWGVWPSLLAKLVSGESATDYPRPFSNLCYRTRQ